MAIEPASHYPKTFKRIEWREQRSMLTQAVNDFLDPRCINVTPVVLVKGKTGGYSVEAGWMEVIENAPTD